ncbi:MAG: hypothetical protein ABL887_02760 [Nitrosomonas sp.]|jgi:hypothetical protein
MVKSAQQGFVYLWALYTVALAGIAMAAAAHVWQAKSLREKEAELMFIGEQFRLAIKSYQSTGTKQFPKTLEDLVEDKRTPNVVRHLRKIYVDPMTNTTEWGIVEEAPPNTNKSAAGNAAATNNPAAAGNKTATGNQQAGSSGGLGSGGGLGGSSSSTNNPASSNNTLTPSGSAAATSGSTATTPGTTSASTNPASNNAATGKSVGSSIGKNLEKRVAGVYSLSEKKPIKKSQFPEQYKKFSEAQTYQDWQFVYKPGDNKGSTGGAAANPAKPNTGAGGASGSSASPFAPQAGSGSGTSSKSSASPFGQPSANKESDSSSGAASPFGR